MTTAVHPQLGSETVTTAVHSQLNSVTILYTPQTAIHTPKPVVLDHVWISTAVVTEPTLHSVLLKQAVIIIHKYVHTCM